MAARLRLETWSAFYGGNPEVLWACVMGAMVLVTIVAVAVSMYRNPAAGSRAGDAPLGLTYEAHAAFCETAFKQNDGVCGMVWPVGDGRLLYCLFSAPSGTPPGRSGRVTAVFDPLDVHLRGATRAVTEADEPCPNARRPRVRHEVARVTFAAQRPLVLRGAAALCFQHLREVTHAGWSCE